jgi:hypothetical protein
MTVRYRLPLKASYVWNAAHRVRKAIDVAGLPLANSTNVPALCSNGLRDYAYGCAFIEQYGSCFNDILNGQGLRELYRLVAISSNDGELSFYAEVTTDAATVALLKLKLS